MRSSQDPEAGLEGAAPEANAYELQSHGILELLATVFDKFIDERRPWEAGDEGAP